MKYLLDKNNSTAIFSTGTQVAIVQFNRYGYVFKCFRLNMESLQFREETDIACKKHLAETFYQKYIAQNELAGIEHACNLLIIH